MKSLSIKTHAITLVFQLLYICRGAGLSLCVTTQSSGPAIGSGFWKSPGAESWHGQCIGREGEGLSRDWSVRVCVRARVRHEGGISGGGSSARLLSPFQPQSAGPLGCVLGKSLLQV